MFSVKDFESLSNLSTFLTAPLFAAGAITSKKIALQLEEPTELLFQVAPVVLPYSLLFVGLIGLPIILSKLNEKVLFIIFIIFLFLALVSLTAGLCQIPILLRSGMQGSMPAHDIFLTLGYILLGFAIIDMVVRTHT